MTAAAADPRELPGKRKQIPLDKVQIGRSQQARWRMMPDLVERYVEHLKDGGTFTDDPEVYFDGVEYWIGDGFHRLKAYSKVGREKVWAFVREGGPQEATFHAAGANADHGMPRTRKDVRRAITLLLRIPDVARLTDKKIAKLARTTDKTVASVKRDLGLDSTERTYVDKHGNETVMDVSGMKRPARIAPTPINAFHQLPVSLRNPLKDALRAMKELSRKDYAFVLTWLAQLPVKPKETGDLLLQLEEEEQGAEAADYDEDGMKF